MARGTAYTSTPGCAWDDFSFVLDHQQIHVVQLAQLPRQLFDWSGTLDRQVNGHVGPMSFCGNRDRLISTSLHKAKNSDQNALHQVDVHM